MTTVRQIQLFIVTRDCCTSGNCFHCTRVTPFGVPRRVVQTRAQGVSKSKAENIARNWSAYNPKIEEVK